VIIAWDVCDRTPRLAWKTMESEGVLEFPGQKPSKVLLNAIDERVQALGPIEKIAVLRGPGSFTGIRTGLASALGLKAALDVPCMGFTKFQVMAMLLPETTGALVLAGPRNSFFIQHLQSGVLAGEPEQVNHSELPSSVTLFSDSDFADVSTTLLNVDYALGCAQLAAQQDDPVAFSLEPLYIRPADTIVGKPLITKLLEQIHQE
jgi:tRNA A37 threonylcarbamoyladenosine modification protein TsaB